MLLFIFFAVSSISNIVLYCGLVYYTILLSYNASILRTCDVTANKLSFCYVRCKNRHNSLAGSSVLNARIHCSNTAAMVYLAL